MEHCFGINDGAKNGNGFWHVMIIDVPYVAPMKN